MSIPERHGIYSVEVDPDSFGGTPVLLNGVMETPHQMGTTVEGEALSGEVFPRFKSITGFARRQTFRTKHIRDSLNNIGLAGLAITSSGAGTGLTFYAQKRAAGGTRAGSGHRSYNISDGIIVPRRLTVSHQGDAEIEYEVFSVSPDGTTDPLTIDAAATLPTGIADAGRYTVGPLTIASAAHTGQTGWEIDFNVDVPTEGSDSDLYDTLASIETIDSSAVFRGIDEGWVSDIGLTGAAIAIADTKWYLRKRAVGSTYVSDVTAEHIQFQAAGMANIESHMEGNPRVGASIRFDTRYDGTNNPLTITVDSAIT